jgi:hypothetical protein
MSLLGVSSVYAEELVDATKADVILEIARGFGSAQLSTDSQGDPKITGRMNGVRYGILFYGCDKEGKNCDDIQFMAGWSGHKVTLKQVNDWNYTKRVGRALLDSDNDPLLLMSVNLDHGVSRRNLDDTFSRWGVALDQFRDSVIKGS